VQGLASFQARSGIDTSVLLPLYGAVREGNPPLEPVGEPFAVQVGPRREEARLLRLVAQDRGPRVFFVEHPGYFDRAGIYGEGSADYDDNARRFALFCLAALRQLPTLVDGPVVLHAHDWHTALAPVYLRAAFRGQRYYDGVASVLSVHNAGFQGHFPFPALADVGLPDALFDLSHLEWYGRVNVLKGGLVFSDMATTVSPTHAIELRTEAGGFGLHDTFVGLRDRFGGILNGIDVDVWDPATDPQITAPYSADDPTGKRRCKAALQRAWGLPERSRTPVFAMSARLVAQKGLDVILGAEALRAAEAQFMFLGAGESRYETALAELASAHPDRIGANFAFTDRLEHRLLAGADFLLMPSLYEPCGLTQMRAQRYGAIPVARRVGGLADTVEDEVTGYLFDEYTPAGFDRAVRRALALFADPPACQVHIREGMTRDFGWARSAARYLEVYRRALASR
jgi:starch synthase